MSALAPQILADFIWRTRYRDETAQPAERDLADTWNRVATAAASGEADRAGWRARFLEILRDSRFLPAGRILAGAGTGREVTLCSCFVMGRIEDSIEGIFDALKEGALTMQQGGGVGYDFSTLRPRGARACGSGTIASGPVSFMRVWDAMCATILSTGARRGAMMATLRCDHPDIEEFIRAKRTAGALRTFNLSVLITDEFMRALHDDEHWQLVFPEHSLESPTEPGTARVLRRWSGATQPVACRIWKTLPARDLWRDLCASAYDCAEPGVLFIDRINATNNLAYCEDLSATNPCAEEPLPPYGACNLGSLNLTAFVQDAFTPSARLNLESIATVAGVAVRFLDNIIEISRFPLPAQHEQAHRKRRIGLGITGLADALAMLSLRYDDERARRVAAEVACTLRDAAYRTSIELARERGSFPDFVRERYLEAPFIRQLPSDLRTSIQEHGIRNSHLLAVAPAGTISLLAGNVSSGIEPIFGIQTLRRILDRDGELHSFHLTDYAYAIWRAGHDASLPLPPCFIESTALQARDHLLMQAAVQPFIDGSLSKTIMLPSATQRDAVADILLTAHRLGLKGCTVFREASRPGVSTSVYLTDRNEAETYGACCTPEREAD